MCRCCTNRGDMDKPCTTSESTQWHTAYSEYRYVYASRPHSVVNIPNSCLIVLEACIPVTVRGDRDTTHSLDSADFKFRVRVEAASGATASKKISTVTCRYMHDMSIHSSKKVLEHRVRERGGQAHVTSTQAVPMLTSRHAADSTNAHAQPQITAVTPSTSAT